ncbi:ABC transporter, ATP-binding protein [Lentilactobacillus kefiri DSM 20587 = JCM 5818]|uniref:ABC transporter, ATP-binding protein n=2 Tax=Lentilactobacillus kefiri TaxID=33962 RepID=A0A8E1V1Y4_LENKE|nr:ABC transporter, ATP-binding protein [Lentilactobacillus parakefiri DSM 10551]KRM54035.1 ABC transporter, ATP-binding protein [Lentilactobacillus kefiri DSM 20587 = JCM 5818]
MSAMLIQAKNLTKTFGSQTAVNHLNISIQSGTLTAVLGPNGAGKTTTISMLTGLLKPTSGTVEMTSGTKISMVFQQSILDDNLSVSENLIIRSRLYKNCSQKYIQSLIETVGLTNLMNQKYGSLSGGQRRRVDIARALINQPDVLFLDEPTAGLDIQTREAIWQLLHSLQEKQQLTIILTTHYLEEADHADEVYIIDQRSVITEGSAEEIKRKNAKSRLILYTNEPEIVLKQIAPTIAGQQSGKSIICWPENSKQALNVLESVENHTTDFEYRRATMDDAFLNLTGKEMR